ncbi:MAG: hypothetical protein J7578_17170 [Chitinophagaceae bacterium]|nr:hypothetical protein [Chitinophagaceae bacterium]
MRIGIFETSHFEVAYSLIRLFDAPDNHITVFAYAPAAKQLEYLLGADAVRFNWVIKPASITRAAFVRTIHSTVQEEGIQTLVLNSVEDNFIHYARLVKRLPTVRALLTLHDINNYFEYRNNGTLRRFVRNFGKKRLIKAVKEFTVLSSTLEDALRSKIPSEKIIRTIPGSIFETTKYQQPAATDGCINITVPGTVDERRRDYASVFTLLEICNNRNIPIKVTLLGAYSDQYGRNIMAKASTYAVKFHNLHWYDEEVVDQPEFDRVMQATHLIFSPVRIHTSILDDVEEAYGITKSSGNMGDMIRFARPAIVPQGLRLPPEFSASVIRYQDIKEIADQLEQIRDNPSKYISLREAAHVCSLQFRPEVFHTRYPGLFTKEGF